MTSHRKHCKGQIMRFSGLPFFPLTEEGLRELVDALERWTLTEAHATAVVDELSEESQRCPTPASIRGVAYAKRPPSPSNGCSVCRGAGFVIHEHGDGITSAAPCACRSAPREAT